MNDTIEIFVPEKRAPVGIRILPGYREELERRPDPFGEKKLVKRYFFNIIDMRDGERKIFTCGFSVAKQIANLIQEPLPKKKRNWFLRFLERLRLIKPLPEEYCDELSLEIEHSRGYPFCVVKRARDQSKLITEKREWGSRN